MEVAVVAAAVVTPVAVAEVDVDVADKLDDKGFEWPLKCLYIYPPSLLLPPFGHSPVILSHS